MLLVLLLLHLLLVEGGRVRLARDGGYRGLVVNVGDDVPEEECAVLVDRIKVSQSHHHQHQAVINIKLPWWCTCCHEIKHIGKTLAVNCFGKDNTTTMTVAINVAKTTLALLCRLRKYDVFTTLAHPPMKTCSLKTSTFECRVKDTTIRYIHTKYQQSYSPMKTSSVKDTIIRDIHTKYQQMHPLIITCRAMDATLECIAIVQQTKTRRANNVFVFVYVFVFVFIFIFVLL